MYVSRLENLRNLVARKIFHIGFVGLLAVPFITDIPPELYIAALTFVGSLLYSIQVRQPIVWEEWRQSFFKALEDAFARLEQLLPLDKPKLRDQYLKAVRQFEELVLLAERDYEKRHGYLGILMGAVGFLTALVLFGKQHLLAALISMAVYDAASAVAGSALGGKKFLGKLTAWGTAVGALLNITALMSLGYTPLASALITALVIAADAASPEDNLTIPLAAAAGSYILHYL
jgi:dolichol kinase